MYTWFDALLVTLLAIVTALGVRRGLVGFIWGVAGVLLCLLLGALVRNVVLAAVLGLLLSAGIAYGLGFVMPQPYRHLWHSLAGGVGGLLLGSVLTAALTLSFPLSSLSKAGSDTHLSQDLPQPLYQAVAGSVIRQRLAAVWTGPKLVRLLLIPDQVKPDQVKPDQVK